MLGLHGCTWAFSRCGRRGPLFVVVWGLLLAVAPLTVVHGLSSSHGTRDTRRPAAEPASPALAGGFLAAGPPGKPQVLGFILVPFCDEDSCWERMPPSARGAVTTIPQTAGLIKKTFPSHSSGAEKSKIRVLAWSGSGDSLLPGYRLPTFCCVLTELGGRALTLIKTVIAS